MANRLSRELSPYLLQHADNPVAWYPWGDEAFARARAEDKPIFLSVGYSTCHWCHVMAHESFESNEVAERLNRDFVPVKVDREERPDVDRVYMAFVQATTGAGGWPMSVWLTPDLKPFFGGTYFPPTSRWGRPGFTQVLDRIKHLWHDDRDRLERSADDLLERLRDAQADAAKRRQAPDADRPAGPDEPPAGSGGRVAGVDTLAAGVAQFERAFDAAHGGFGQAPKFPRPAEVMFLLREHHRTGHVRAREMALQTLDAMANGGMRDHLGGGFHRYAVDAAWRIPHFEKMLYDQAQLVCAYLEAGQLTGECRWLDVAADTVAYVQRDLIDPQGGFVSAEDADSVPPGQDHLPDAPRVEGAYYVWTLSDVERVLDEEVDARVVASRFGLEADGNAPDDPTGELRGQNQLFLARPIEQVAALTSLAVEDARARLARATAALLAARQTRARPHLDDKVLAAWNGLMIGASARAAHVLDGTAWQPTSRDGDGAGRLDAAAARALAERAATFARRRLWDADRGILRRRYRAGQASIDGYCEDYACMIWGSLELFQATGSPEWLAWALALQARQDALFWDDDDGGWFSTSGDDPSVLLRIKDDYDGAEPSAGSISVANVLTLAQLGSDTARDRAERALLRFGASLGHAARIVPLMATALARWHTPASQIVVVGPPSRDDTRALWRRIADHYMPSTVRIPVAPDEQPALAAMLPFVGPMTMIDGQATAYVCADFACRAPVTDAEQLADALRAVGMTTGDR